MEGCICATKRRWFFYHLTYCPWRLRVERLARREETT